MGARVWNFSAGPATLPVPVLERVRDELLDHRGSGMSVLEMSHRSRWFEDIAEEAEANLRELMAIPPSHQVLFLQGGASLQFAMAAMNLLPAEQHAAHVVTGSWGKKALAEARRIGDARVAWDGKDERYTRVPQAEELTIEPGAAYLHFASNETIQGVQWPREPAVDLPLVCDMSSDFLSRPVPIERYGLIYAGAQKNAGPAGVTVAVLGENLRARIPDGLPAILDYRTHIEHRSLYNTPPTFSVYVLMLVTRWLRDDVGGLEKMEAVNREKAALVYEEIDGSDGFYRGHAAPSSRSSMNATWRLPDEKLERRFVAEATEQGLIELKGHRSVGGIRASIYNAMPLEGVRALRDFMVGFRRS